MGKDKPVGRSSVDVTLDVIDDRTYEGTETANLELVPGTNYVVGTSSASLVGIADNELPVVLVESDDSTRVTEDGTDDSYEITLQAQPATDVVIAMNTDGQTRVTPSQLTFTQENWDQPQTVTVAAVVDNVIEGTHSGMISLTAAGADPVFNGIAMPLAVNITDGAAPDAVLSGYVYMDMNKTDARDGTDMGVPGVLITLTGTDVRGPVTAQVMTAADGSYRFEGLRAGTYQVAERQPPALCEGGANTIVDLVLLTHDQLTNLDFREGSLKTQYVSRHVLMASNQGSFAEIFREVLAGAEAGADNASLADLIRQAGIPSTVCVNPQAYRIATGRPDLVVTSDTGLSQQDDLTSLNNSSAENTLSFAVDGVRAGALVQICADGVVIGQATAIGPAGATVGVTVTSDGIATLADGRHSITATQTIASETSAASESLAVTIDAAPPQIISSTPEGEQAGDVEELSFTFNEVCNASTLSTEDIQLASPSNQTVPISDVLMLDDSLSLVASFAAQSCPGEYSVTVQNVEDLAGNTMREYRKTPAFSIAGAEVVLLAWQPEPASLLASPVVGLMATAGAGVSNKAAFFSDLVEKSTVSSLTMEPSESAYISPLDEIFTSAPRFSPVPAPISPAEDVIILPTDVPPTSALPVPTDNEVPLCVTSPAAAAVLPEMPLADSVPVVEQPVVVAGGNTPTGSLADDLDLAAGTGGSLPSNPTTTSSERSVTLASGSLDGNNNDLSRPPLDGALANTHGSSPVSATAGAGRPDTGGAVAPPTSSAVEPRQPVVVLRTPGTGGSESVDETTGAGTCSPCNAVDPLGSSAAEPAQPLVALPMAGSWEPRSGRGTQPVTPVATCLVAATGASEQPDDGVAGQTPAVAPWTFAGSNHVADELFEAFWMDYTTPHKRKNPITEPFLLDAVLEVGL